MQNFKVTSYVGSRLKIDGTLLWCIIMAQTMRGLHGKTKKKANTESFESRFQQRNVKVAMVHSYAMIAKKEIRRKLLRM